MTRKLSWEPVRRNVKGVAVYCAPACGRGCTKAEYDRAVAGAKKLLGRMKGKGWTIRVWENLGWHYEVCNGPINVWPGMNGEFHCLMSDQIHGHGGSMLWTPAKSWGKDPNRIVRRQLQLAEAKVNCLLMVVNRVKKIIKLGWPERIGTGLQIWTTWVRIPHPTPNFMCLTNSMANVILRS